MRVPKAVKTEIVLKIKQGEKVTDFSKQYGISDKTIYYWLRQNTGDKGVPIVKYNKLKRKNEELKRLLGEITLEMSMGKKIDYVRHAVIKSVCADDLGVNRKNIYHVSVLDQKDEALKSDIAKVHKKHSAYGHRRLALHLKINHKRTAKVHNPTAQRQDF